MNILNTILFNIVVLIKVINIFNLNMLIYKINNWSNKEEYKYYIKKWSEN